ncbi:NAD(P)-dependent oxidoreductase [Taklimakanibacter albus]|uniref:NAD(P)-dependent oxidoreductase n=1 Tax=Taklimakanibacter albus TaxID=2800327 RepID=A0ACC5R096_9HYPH|nr:NAD(P)-dependent oxidoreductase [Aestuariivirga sp. YIM B02566]MBK1865853.1 NAD(P)-dependent oxidoreductase [Aestuariivirga sp. YIM B02566]
MTNAASLSPALILGATGSLGARTVRMLRRLHPELPLVLAARDMVKAEALAREVGHATTAKIDIAAPGLGLDPAARHSIVVTALRDHSFNSLRYAQAQGVAYIALSDGVFELGPIIAHYAHHAKAAPILLLGHSNGGVPTLAALHFASEFETVEAIELGLLFDPGDPFGAVSAKDLERINRIGPKPLVKEDGQWQWAEPPLATRSFTSVDGTTHEAHAAGLLDVLSLGSATQAARIRIDLAGGLTATTKQGGSPSVEVIIEITGMKKTGETGRFRYELVDPEGYAAMSARGVAVAIERLLGLARRSAPKTGLYLPEKLIQPEYLLERLKIFDVSVRAS